MEEAIGFVSDDEELCNRAGDSLLELEVVSELLKCSKEFSETDEIRAIGFEIELIRSKYSNIIDVQKCLVPKFVIFHFSLTNFVQEFT